MQSIIIIIMMFFKTDKRMAKVLRKKQVQVKTFPYQAQVR